MDLIHVLQWRAFTDDEGLYTANAALLLNSLAKVNCEDAWRTASG